MKKLLIKNIKWFVLITLASIIIWTSIFSSINKPKDYETLQIFISSSSYKEESLKETLNKDNSYKDVIIYSADEDNKYYTSLLETSGILSCDLLIVNKSLVLTDGAESTFVPLSQEYLSSYKIDLSKYQLVNKNNITYGIVIYDKENNINLLGDYITFDSDQIYCLCLNTISYHVGVYSNKINNVSNKAFETLANLLN